MKEDRHLRLVGSLASVRELFPRQHRWLYERALGCLWDADHRSAIAPDIAHVFRLTGFELPVLAEEERVRLLALTKGIAPGPSRDATFTARTLQLLSAFEELSSRQWKTLSRSPDFEGGLLHLSRRDTFAVLAMAWLIRNAPRTPCLDPAWSRKPKDAPHP